MANRSEGAFSTWWKWPCRLAKRSPPCGLCRLAKCQMPPLRSLQTCKMPNAPPVAIADLQSGERPPVGQIADLQNGKRPPVGQIADLQSDERPPVGQIADLQNGERPPVGQIADLQNGKRPPVGQFADLQRGYPPPQAMEKENLECPSRGRNRTNRNKSNRIIKDLIDLNRFERFLCEAD